MILRLRTPDSLTIGKLGTFHFRAGWYTYVGSAMGAGGLRGRLKHHLAPLKKPHWHIDYLRQGALIEQIWYGVGDVNREHEWAKLLYTTPGARVVVPRFGASDCRCTTHLFHFAARPNIDRFQSLQEGLSVWKMT